MKNTLFAILAVIVIGNTSAQEVVTLQSTPALPEMKWIGGEHQSVTDVPIVSNVSTPTLTVYLPDADKATGTAMVIAPGGAFHLLAIEHEGTQVAQWCADHGIAAFVLKYRLVPTTGNPGEAFGKLFSKGREHADSVMRPYIDLAKADGRAAIQYVREHAKEYNVDPHKIGIIGFSAGGTVAAAAGLEYRSEVDRPDFIAPIYGAMHVFYLQKLPNEPMPLFMAVTSDDSFGFQAQSMEIFKTWNAAKLPVELHIYEKGGHGFGMKHQNLPSDDWINVFGAWLQTHGF